MSEPSPAEIETPRHGEQAEERRPDPRPSLEQLRSTVEDARSVPMSASVVVNKADILGQLTGLESVVAAALEDSERLLAQRDSLIADARAEARRIVDEATQERDRLVADSEVLRAGRQDVERLKRAVERESAALRQETDAYVDERLAQLEVSLTKTLEAVRRGRDRLQGRSDLSRLGAADDPEGTGGFAFPE